MEKMRVRHTDDAVSGVTALREILAVELASIETLIGIAAQTGSDQEEDRIILEAYSRLRTSLISGIISADEVLGWVHALAERDPDGNELECVKHLPHINVLPPS